MKKRLLSLFVILAMIIGTITVPPQSAKADGVTGTGTKDDPYVVTTANDLFTYLGKTPGYVKLGSDISVTDSDTVRKVSNYNTNGGLDFNGYVLDFSNDTLASSGSSGYRFYLDASSGTETTFEMIDSCPERDHGNRFIDPDGNPIKGAILCGHNIGCTEFLIRTTEILIKDITIMNNSPVNGGIFTSGLTKNIVAENLNFYYNDVSASLGDGVFCTSVSTVTVKNVRAEGNYSNNSGLFCFRNPSGAKASVSLEDVVIKNNRAKTGAGLYSSADKTHLTNVTITNNVAETPNTDTRYYVSGYQNDYYSTGIEFSGKVVIKENYMTLASGAIQERNASINMTTDKNNPGLVYVTDFDAVNSDVGYFREYGISEGSKAELPAFVNIKDYLAGFSSDHGGTIEYSDGKVYLFGKKVYTVVLNSNYEGGKSYEKKVAEGNTISGSITPTREGYTFTGWYKDANCTQPWNFATDTVRAATTLYAGWLDPTSFKITYDPLNGQEEYVAYSYAESINRLDEAPTAPSSGIVFDGWYTKPIGGNPVDSENPLACAGKYYAHWKKNDKKVLATPIIAVTDAESGESLAEEPGLYTFHIVKNSSTPELNLLDDTDLADIGLAYNNVTKEITLDGLYSYIYLDGAMGLGGINLVGAKANIKITGNNVLNVVAKETPNSPDGSICGIYGTCTDLAFYGDGKLGIDVDGNRVPNVTDEFYTYGIMSMASRLTNNASLDIHAYNAVAAAGITTTGTITNNSDIDIQLGIDINPIDVVLGIQGGSIILNSGTITVTPINIKDGGSAKSLVWNTELSVADDKVCIAENLTNSAGEVVEQLTGMAEEMLLVKELDNPAVIRFEGNKVLRGVFSNGSDPVVLYDKKSGVSNLNYQPTYGDYIFDGWYTRPIGGEKITPTEDVLNVGENTLYAQWKNAEGVKVLERTLIVAITNADAVDSPYHDAPVIGYYDGDREWVYFNDLNALSGYGITYNDASGALVLDGVCADIQAIGDIPAWIYAVDEELKLELGGENKVRVAATEQQETYYGLYGIAASHDVNISGDGALDLVVDGSGYPSDEAAACGIYSMGSTTCEANITLEVSDMKNLYGIYAVSDVACAGELNITVGSDDFEALTGIGIETDTITYNGGKISVDIINISGDNKAIEWTGKIFSNKTNKVTNAVDNSNKSITEIETFEETSSLSQKEAGSPLVIEEKSNPLPPPGPGPNPPTPGPSPDPSPAPEPTPEPEPEPKKPVEYEAPAKNAGEAPITAVIEEKKAVVDEISEKMLDQIVKDSKEKPVKDKTDDLVIDLSKAEEDVEAVVFSKESIENIADAVSDQKFSSVTIVLSDTEVKLDSTAVESISKQMTGDVIDLVVAKTQETTLSETQKESVRSLNVQLSFEAYFECNGKRIGQFGGGVIEVSMSYLKSPRQNSDFLHVYYIGDDGTRERYNTKYKNGRVIFSTKHFSDYVIVYDEDDPNENHVTEAAAPDVNPEFGELRPWSSIVNGKKFTISWEPVEGADGYEILASKCNSLGQKYKIRNIKTINGGDVTSYTMKSLKKGTFYKFKIRAFKKVNGKKVTIASSVLFHTVTNGGKFDVADYVEVSQIGDKTYKTTSKKSKKNGSSVNFEMKAGATAQITAKEVSDGKIAHHVGIRYETSNPEVATVDADGVITAVKKGKCEVYVYAQNGVHKVVKLSVTK